MSLMYYLLTINKKKILINININISYNLLEMLSNHNGNFVKKNKKEIVSSVYKLSKIC